MCVSQGETGHRRSTGPMSGGSGSGDTPSSSSPGRTCSVQRSCESTLPAWQCLKPLPLPTTSSCLAATTACRLVLMHRSPSAAACCMRDRRDRRDGCSCQGFASVVRPSLASCLARRCLRRLRCHADVEGPCLQALAAASPQAGRSGGATAQRGVVCSIIHLQRTRQWSGRNRITSGRPAERTITKLLMLAGFARLVKTRTLCKLSCPCRPPTALASAGR